MNNTYEPDPENENARVERDNAAFASFEKLGEKLSNSFSSASIADESTEIDKQPKVHMDITNISAEQSEAIGVALDERGCMYDEHYTALYGAGWAVIGVRLLKEFDLQLRVAMGVLNK